MGEQKVVSMSRNKMIDLLRGICVLLMVFCHTIRYMPMRYIIYMFHMPFFFFCTGYMLKRSSKVNGTLCEKVRHSFRTLMIPYIVTAFLQCVFLVFRNINSGSMWNRKLIEQILASGLGLPITKGLFPGLEVNCGPIWFIPCLFFAKVLFLYMEEKCKNIVSLGACVMFVSTIGLLISTKYYLPYSIDVSMVACIYIYIGYLYEEYIVPKVIENNGKLVYGLILVLIPLVLYCQWNEWALYYNMAARIYPGYHISFFTNICFVILLLWIFRDVEIPIIQYFGKKSGLILCVHTLENSFIPYHYLLRNYDATTYAYQFRRLGIELIVFFLVCKLSDYIVLVRKNMGGYSKNSKV